VWRVAVFRASVAIPTHYGGRAELGQASADRLSLERELAIVAVRAAHWRDKAPALPVVGGGAMADEMGRTRAKVRWEEMFPDEIVAAQASCPVAYLSFGLCEPHGPHLALGNDALKAHALCVRAAEEHGGVVAPPFFWHIHETGYHAPWADQWIGAANPFLTSLPPWVLLKVFLYQLRAVAARGFRAAIVVTGHYGGCERDLRLVAEVFAKHSSLRLWVGADHEAIQHPVYRGDHAGATETSQLWALRPELVDISRVTPADAAAHRYATGGNVFESSRRLGDEIVAGQVAYFGERSRELLASHDATGVTSALSFDATESIWREVEARRDEWVTLRLWDGQSGAPEGSAWEANEKCEWGK
jgi:creatinine amidohydrolase